MNADKKATKERLALHLKKLAGYCKLQDTDWSGTRWPDRLFLQSLENHVMLLIATERKKRPSPAWKAFQLLDRRMPKLLLVKRVDNLVKRAGNRLEEAAQHPLSKLQQQAECGDENARKLLRDIAAIRDGQDAAKKIDWTEHERALAQFSRTRSVEPSYGRSAPLEFRCYARALELIVDDCRRKPLKSWPLTEWTGRIGHPDAKSLLAFDDPTGFIIEEGAWRGESTLRRREKVRERVRRHREWYRGKWVYPGDWLKFRDAGDFRRFYGKRSPLPEVCSGLEDSHCRDDLAAVLDSLSCGRKLSEQPEGFYLHRTRHVARCRDCQEAEWIADGYEIEGGWPCTFAGSDDTREGRLAARERYYREAKERGQRWSQAPEGQQ